MRFRAFASVLIVMAWSWASLAQAQLTIEVTKGVAGGIPIAIVPFQTSGTPPQTVSDVVETDLGRSGRFDPLPRGDFLGNPSQESEVQFKDWRLIKAEALVVGKVQPVGADQYMVQFELFDVFKGTRLEGRRWPVVPGRLLRKVAHQISDIVYQQLLGVRGAFDTRIGYVTEDRDSSGKKRFLLVVADSDGYGPQVVLNSKEPILSPAWSPDGTQLAYVSFERRHAEVWVQRITDGNRRKLASFPGLNSAPAWSPDGNQLALSLSKDGNPEIYVMNLDGSGLRRITNQTAIDTEPAWSPDGKYLVFTSDRSGAAQIYRVSVAGGSPERLTFNGRQNLRASYAPDGRSLALVTNQNGNYRIGLFDMNTRSLKVLTDGRLDESPSFAPNGSMILYATQAGGRGVLAAVSSDGRVKQVLKFQKGAVREPAWSPFNRQF